MHSKSFCPFSAPFPTLSLGHQILDDLLDSYFIVFSFALVSSSTTKWHHYTTSLERADFSNIFCYMLPTQATHYPGNVTLSFSGCSSSACLSPCQVLWVLSHPMMFQWWEGQMPSEGQLSSWWSPSWWCIFPSFRACPGSVIFLLPGCHSPTGIVFNSLMPTLLWAPPIPTQKKPQGDVVRALAARKDPENWKL